MLKQHRSLSRFQIRAVVGMLVVAILVVTIVLWSDKGQNKEQRLLHLLAKLPATCPVPLEASMPLGASGMSAAYDPEDSELIMYGGVDVAAFCDFDVTWLRTGGVWRQYRTSQNPPAIIGAAMAYDAASGQVIMFGGTESFGDTVAGTWLWNGSNWHLAKPLTKPPAMSFTAMAYDEAIGQVIMIGSGNIPESATNPYETWAWNGRNWVALHPSQELPKRLVYILVNVSDGRLLAIGTIMNPFNDYVPPEFPTITCYSFAKAQGSITKWVELDNRCSGS